MAKCEIKYVLYMNGISAVYQYHFQSEFCTLSVYNLILVYFSCHPKIMKIFMTFHWKNEIAISLRVFSFNLTAQACEMFFLRSEKEA